MSGYPVRQRNSRYADADAAGLLPLANGGMPPGSLRRRYDAEPATSLRRQGRLTYYLARKHFQLSPAGWEELPWWEKRMLLEGLELERIIAGPGEQPIPSGAPVPAQAVKQPGTVVQMTRREVAVDFSQLAQQMSELQAGSK